MIDPALLEEARVDLVKELEGRIMRADTYDFATEHVRKYLRERDVRADVNWILAWVGGRLHLTLEVCEDIAPQIIQVTL